MKSISQERDELRNKVGVCEIQLKATSEEKAVTDREFIDSKEEVQSVKNQLLELKENLQVEQKEKEVSKSSKMSPSSLPSLTHRSITIGEGSSYLKGVSGRSMKHPSHPLPIFNTRCLSQ